MKNKLKLLRERKGDILTGIGIVTIVAAVTLTWISWMSIAIPFLLAVGAVAVRVVASQSESTVDTNPAATPQSQ